MSESPIRSASIVPLNIQEFRVLFLEGRLRLAPSRFVETNVDEEWRPAIERERESELLDSVPVFELDDEHTMVWAVLENRMPKRKRRPVEIAFDQLRALHAFSERAQRRLRADFKDVGLDVREPLCPDAAEELWLNRYVQVHLDGGPALNSMITDLSCSTLAPAPEAELRAAVKARHDGVKFEEAEGFLSILFSYDRHDPFPPPVGCFLDFGKVVRAFFEWKGCKEEPMLVGYREFAKALIKEHHTEDCADVLLSRGYWAQMCSILWADVLPIHPDAAVLFLHWKYQLEELGEFSVAPILDVKHRLPARCFTGALTAAIYLIGVFWGFHNLAEMYFAEKMRGVETLYGAGSGAKKAEEAVPRES